jgi:hypothetical protein
MTVSFIPLVRLFALADYTGDIVIVCSGGTPAAQGAPLPFVNFTLSLDTSITSRQLAPNWSEALLMVDEPGSVFSPGTPQLVCGAAGTTEISPGGCTMTGTGTGAGVYSGTGARPNVFQAKQTAGNQVVWQIPFDPPPLGGMRVFRMTNIRTDDILFEGGTPSGEVMARVSLSGPIEVLLSNSFQTVAFGVPEMTMTVASLTKLSRCMPSNAALFADPTANGTPNFEVRFQENFTTAFRVRAGGAFAGPDVSPTPTPQNTPGMLTYNETDFYNPAFPALPGRGDLSRAGLADQGTRLRVSFTEVPTSVLLFAQTTVPMVKISDGTPSGGWVRLVSTAPDGSGAFSPVLGNAFGIAPIPLSRAGHGQAGQAVFEVMNADPFNTERADVPIYVAFVPPHVGAETAIATGSLAPLNVVDSALTTPIPRFYGSGIPRTAFSLLPPCR